MREAILISLCPPRIWLMRGVLLLSLLLSSPISFLGLAAENRDIAWERIVAGSSAFNVDGFFTFLTGSYENTRLHLVRVGGEKLEYLFGADMGGTVKLPICLDDCVVTADVDGVVYKFDFSGRLVFKKKPAGFQGVGGLSGKFNATHIFLTETKWDARRKGWAHELHLINVAGAEPVIAASLRMKTFGRVVVVWDTIVILGLRLDNKMEIQKLKVPTNIVEAVADRKQEGANFSGMAR